MGFRRAARLFRQILRAPVPELAADQSAIGKPPKCRAEPGVAYGRRVAVAKRSAIVTKAHGMAGDGFPRIGMAGGRVMAGRARLATVQRQDRVEEQRLAKGFGCREGDVLALPRAQAPGQRQRQKTRRAKGNEPLSQRGS